jgi:hypothetical protein
MKSIVALVTVAALIAPGVALAEISKKFGDIEIHYNAISTDELVPEVAKSYKLDRSKNRGLLTISVLKKNNLGVGQPIKASINASAVNLSLQLQNIDMREIQEGNAIYYLGEYRITAPETLKFKLEVKPAGTDQNYKVEFQQQFFR